MSKKRTKALRDADAKRTGRPPLPKKERRDRVVPVRMTAAEYTRLKKDAKQLGMSVSGLLMSECRKRWDKE